MGPPTRVNHGKKVAVGPKPTLTKASNSHRASKMVAFEGDNSVCALHQRMRQLIALQYGLPSTRLTPAALLQTKLAETQRSLHPRPQDVAEIQTEAPVGSKVWIRLQLLVRLTNLLGRNIEKQGSSSSSVMKDNDLSLPLSKEEALLQQFQNMSLAKSYNVDDRKAVDEVGRVLKEAMDVKKGNELVSRRVEKLDKVGCALARRLAHSLCKSLHLNLAEKSLVPCSHGVGEIRTKPLSATDMARLLFYDKVLQRLGPSTHTVMPDLDTDKLAQKIMLKPPPSVEKQSLSAYKEMVTAGVEKQSLSAYKEMVTAVEHKADLPPNYEDLVLQSLQKMSLAEQEHFF